MTENTKENGQERRRIVVCATRGQNMEKGERKDLELSLLSATMAFMDSMFQSISVVACLWRKDISSN
jgi:hypothetical protein